MDCGLAREQLDVARPDSADRESPELEAAFAHVDSCPECAEVVEFRREFDRRAGSVIRDVPVPAGLKERLLAAAELTVQPAAETPRPSRRARRKFLLATSSAAALLVAAGAAWFFGGDAPHPIALHEVREFWSIQLSEPAAVEELPAFDGNFDPSIPDLRWADHFQEAPQGADIDGDGLHDAAVYQFQTGFLVVLAPGRIEDAPAAESPFAADQDYTPILNVAWTDAGQVHLCYVQKGGVNGLKAILDYVYDAHA